LLGGSSYRVSVRHPGFVPYFSDRLRLDGERATIPPIRLQALRMLSGRIQDRQGGPVAGARVFVPGGGPATATDSNGGFALGRVSPGKTVVLVEHSGFWLQGWLVDPSARGEMGPFVLVRRNHRPAPIIKPMSDPISPEEARALANRLLEPYLREEPRKRDDRARLAAIASLGEFDLLRALDRLQDGRFPDEDPTYQFTRSKLARILALTDPASADAMAEAIPAPARKAQALADIARALPASERARKRDLLERVAFVLRNDLLPRHAALSPPGQGRSAARWPDGGSAARPGRTCDGLGLRGARPGGGQEAGRLRGRRSSDPGKFECMLLARYDREVAAVQFQRMDDYLRSLAAGKGPQSEFNSRAISGKGCIEPRAAVALLESLTAPREFSRNHPVHDARLTLAEALGLPSEKRWRRLWRSMAAQIPLDE
jgi:hypothetical protein